jgi:DNA-binding NtrC family response regulator
VLDTLKRADGNRTRAARELGISLRGLQYKLRRYANPESVADDREDHDRSASAGSM